MQLVAAFFGASCWFKPKHVTSYSAQFATCFALAGCPPTRSDTGTSRQRPYVRQSLVCVVACGTACCFPLGSPPCGQVESSDEEEDSSDEVRERLAAAASAAPSGAPGDYLMEDDEGDVQLSSDLPPLPTLTSTPGVPLRPLPTAPSSSGEEEVVKWE